MSQIKIANQEINSDEEWFLIKKIFITERPSSMIRIRDTFTWGVEKIDFYVYLSIIIGPRRATKPVFGVADKARLKPDSSATETS